jgi:hypothetical protein
MNARHGQFSQTVIKKTDLMSESKNKTAEISLMIINPWSIKHNKD